MYQSTVFASFSLLHPASGISSSANAPSNKTVCLPIVTPVKFVLCPAMPFVHCQTVCGASLWPRLKNI